MPLLDPRLEHRLAEKLARLNRLRPLPAPALRKLQEQFQIEMTYNSNGIEGNRLTLKETFLVINEGITIKGKPLKDHLEAKDHKAALEYLYDLVESGRRVTVSERVIRELHQLVVRDVDREWAGRYRTGLVQILGATHRPSEASDVPKQMQALVTWMSGKDRPPHPVIFAALAHHRLAAIHPFFDGNGRTARLVMNLLLMRAGYPLAIILKHDRKKYYRVLERADEGELEPLVRFVAQAVERSLDLYLKALKPSIQKGERLVPLSVLSRGTRYSAKYLNLLARQGKLEAHKEGRNWVASKEALRRYEEGRQRKR